MTPSDRDALLERLEVGEWSGKAYGKLIERGTTIWPRNPEGAEAAALIRQQAETIARLREALKELADEAEGQLCIHEDTHRGGTIWTICEQCGQKWADDEGGFVPYQAPAYIRRARATLDETGV